MPTLLLRSVSDCRRPSPPPRHELGDRPVGPKYSALESPRPLKPAPWREVCLVANVQIGSTTGISGLNERPESAPRPAAAAAGFGSALERAESSGGVVKAVRTRLSTDEARQALEHAWTARFGSPPSEETTAILTAQWAHETGDGASMFNYNFGGIKGSGPSGLSVAQRTREGYGASERTIIDRFRAYDSAEQGAADYLSLLDRKYAAALDSAHRGDAKGFVSGLHAGGYFTGNKDAYTRSVSSRTEALLGRSVEIQTDLTRPASQLVDPIAPMTNRPQPTAVRRETLASLSLEAQGTRRSSTLSNEDRLSQFTDHLALAALRIAAAPSKENT